MSHTYFDHNQNLQVNGDITFVSTGRPSEDDPSFLQVTQRVQLTNAQSRALERGFKILCDNTAPSARYGYGHSFKGPQCHPGTRLAVQGHIFNWLNDPNGEIAMWMNGPVGIGKSAIAQTVAQLAAKEKQLSSAFFFFRSDETRNSAKHLVPTLAYEMTQQMAHTRNGVCQTIDADPLILSASLEYQVDNILLKPLCALSKPSQEAVYRLIIIDGLDECLDVTAQQSIIWSFISSLLSMSTYLLPHKLLIVSRPESHIASAFEAASIRSHVKYFSLDSWSTRADIRKFLCDKLKEIKNTHPMKHHLTGIWPDPNSFCKLQERSVGSFAYASCVIRFLASHKHDPNRALQDILSANSLHGAPAFTDLDALYRHILSSLDPDICFMVQKVLCLHLYSSNGEFARLAGGLRAEHSVVEIALIHVSSLVNFDGRSIKLHHKSFEEFLRDKERSKEYCVFSPNVTSAIATALSNLWLRPINDENQYCWFETMSEMIHGTDVTISILRTLVATKLPPSMFSPEHGYKSKAINSVISFMADIQLRCIRGSDSPYGSLYSEAFNVVCAWLRLQLNILFGGRATLDDVLNTISGNVPNYNQFVKLGGAVFDAFRRLLRKNLEPIGFLCRLFPDMNYLEICCGIVRGFLTSSREHQLNVNGRPPHPSSEPQGVINLKELYSIVLDQEEAMVPKLCHQFEKLVVNGRKVLRVIPSQYMTSEHCIFRILRGTPSCLENMEQLPRKINNAGVRNVDTLMWAMLAKKTDNYIRRAHAKLDFPYISEDVGALYRSPPAKFDVWCWPSLVSA